MTLPSLLMFSMLAFVTFATPGPTVLLALDNGSRHGLRRALPGMLGAVLSDLVLVAAVAAGLGTLLLASPQAFAVLQWAGVAYLAWLGVTMWRSAADVQPPLTGQRENARRGGRDIFLKSFLVAVSNPKALLFYSALLPPFVDPTQPQAAQFLLLAAIVVLVDMAVLLAYGLLGAQAVRRAGGQVQRWMARLCGGALLGLALLLASYRRLQA